LARGDNLLESGLLREEAADRHMLHASPPAGSRREGGFS
jgi:hypothetical protein